MKFILQTLLLFLCLTWTSYKSYTLGYKTGYKTGYDTGYKATKAKVKEDLND